MSNTMSRARTTAISHTSRLTCKGQVTIPVQLRRALHLKPGDEVAFVQDGDGVRLEPARSIAERTAGILAMHRREPPLSAEEERSRAEIAWAEDVLRRSGG
jgi:AbrB family looped-hinge helix DNA binding protein